MMPRKELLDDLQRLPLTAVRPAWLTTGAIKLGVLCAFIVVIGMARPRLSPDAAGWIVLGGGLGTLAGALAFLVATRYQAARSSLLDRSERVFAAVFVLLRKTGLPILGLVFFLSWTFVYLGVWWFNPDEAFKGLVAACIAPTARDVASDAALEAWLLQTAGNAHHTSGTCKMGPASDYMAVVDQYCRVHGMQGLRVVDASIMPNVTRSNTNATTIMIAERVAEWMQ